MSKQSSLSRGRASARGRGTFLIVTVFILLAAAGAWIATFTKAVELQPVGSASQPVSPADTSSGTTRSGR